MLTIEQMQADIDFLLHRSVEAGSCSFDDGERFTGMSSNAIVCLAYGGEQDALPLDRSDYAACVRTVRMLPKHRKTPAVWGALKLAREAYLSRYPDDRSALFRRKKQRAWEEEQRRKWERQAKRRKHG